MKKTNVFIIVLLLLLAVAFISKPSDSECRETAADKKMQEYKSVLFEGLARKIVVKGITVEDKILFKQIKFSYDGQTQTLGWAAFGQVMMTD